MRIFESQAISTGNPDSRLRFETERGPVGVGDRYLLIDGKRAYKLGIDCQTCSLLFGRLNGANQSVEIENTAEALRKGVGSLSDATVRTVGAGLPEGEYLAFLGETTLRIAYPGARAIISVRIRLRFGARVSSGACRTIHPFHISERANRTSVNHASFSISLFQCIQRSGSRLEGRQSMSENFALSVRGGEAESLGWPGDRRAPACAFQPAS
jgi:hypothetical protein